ncbi:hypothetical protein SAMN03159390_00596 [Pseudomonas sp. NFACC49-2]|uniref:hypothetical protein n=1 Tax=Pseudomonas sp. NFACC49-2 TaxID=1566222 RepID=UPI000912D3E2|nr:hypothetical protein [Pseudomonas sp. NFACC49-2]SFX16721.1 hypothetical protein SAMN03159390_00596 [Pseudomonas sp. NFACC49-2]
MSIDWSNAPEGAEFWSPDSKIFYRELDGEFQKFSEDRNGWMAAAGKRSDYTTLIARPAAWTGEGLPPVGTVCELRAHKLTDWSPAKIEFAYRNVIVWDWVDEPSMNGLCTAYAHDVETRPLRTPEQIAAEERRTAIKKMQSDAECHVYADVFGRLYDAGYRKQVTP